MRLIFIAFMVCVILTGITCAPSNKSDNRENQKSNEVGSINNISSEIECYLDKMIQTNEIPGMALGVIKEGVLIYETYKGSVSLETDEKVTSNTLFRLYSTTKLITVVAIFKLVEEGKIKLSDPISNFINDLPENWKHIEVHHLIAHSSGLPDIMNFDLLQTDENMLEKLFKENIEFDAGEKFVYNQTNYWFLAKIIKRVSDQSYEDFVLKFQFENDKKNIIFSSNHTDTIERKANLYWYQADKNEYEIVKVDFGQRANSSTGLILSLRDFIEWNKRLDEDILLNDKTKQMMWTSYDYKDIESEFLYGWGTYSKNSIGFTGSGVTGYRKFLDEDMTIIFLSNGFKKSEPVHNEIIDEVGRIALKK